METTYRMAAIENRFWHVAVGPIRDGNRRHIRDMARAKAKEKGAQVVNIETPVGVIVDTLEVA